jgi:MFS family permease
VPYRHHPQAAGTPRTLFLLLASLLMTAVTAAASAAELPHLPAVAVVAGLAFGAHWSLVSAIVSDLYGLSSFASNYTTLQLAPALGSYCLATLLAGFLYDREAQRQSGGQHHECEGRGCFGAAFQVLAALGLVGSGCAALLLERSRRAYAVMVARLRREVALAADVDVLQ